MVWGQRQESKEGRCVLSSPPPLSPSDHRGTTLCRKPAFNEDAALPRNLLHITEKTKSMLPCKKMRLSGEQTEKKLENLVVSQTQGSLQTFWVKFTKIIRRAIIFMFIPHIVSIASFSSVSFMLTQL